VRTSSRFNCWSTCPAVDLSGQTPRHTVPPSCWTVDAPLLAVSGQPRSYAPRGNSAAPSATSGRQLACTLAHTAQPANQPEMGSK